MARTANTIDKALEEFDARVRELMKHAQVDQKRTKKRARPKGRTRTKPVVVERKVQAPRKVRKGTSTSRKVQKEASTLRELLPFAINAMYAMKNVGATRNPAVLEEALRPVLRAMTAEQIEKMQSIFTPAQVDGLNKLWKKLVGEIAGTED